MKENVFGSWVITKIRESREVRVRWSTTHLSYFGIHPNEKTAEFTPISALPSNPLYNSFNCRLHHESRPLNKNYTMFAHIECVRNFHDPGFFRDLLRLSVIQ